MRRRSLPRRRGLGRLGMCEFVDPCIRRLLAARLEARAEPRAVCGSQDDELAEDPMLLLDVVLGIEARFGISIPERMLAQVRSCDDLVRLTVDLICAREDAARATEVLPSPRVRSVVQGRRGERVLERVLDLTPYEAETVIEDATHMGPGTELQVFLPSGAPDADVTAVGQLLARHRAQGIRITVLREGASAPETPLVRVSAAAPAEFAVLIGCLLHEIQSERSLSTALVTARRSEFRDGTRAQREGTNRALGDLRVFLGAHEDDLAPIARMHADAVRRLLEQLEPARAEIDGFQYDAGEVIDFFTQINTELLAAADALVAGASQADLSRMATAHLAFLHAKEEAALGRAEMARALAPERQGKRQERLLASYAVAREFYLRMFATTAPEDVLDVYREQTADPAFVEAARLEEAMLARAPEGIDVAAGFHAMAARLERLRNVESQSAAALLRQSVATPGH